MIIYILPLSVTMTPCNPHLHSQFPGFGGSVIITALPHNIHRIPRNPYLRPRIL